jgi:integrase
MKNAHAFSLLLKPAPSAGAAMSAKPNLGKTSDEVNESCPSRQARKNLTAAGGAFGTTASGHLVCKSPLLLIRPVPGHLLDIYAPIIPRRSASVAIGRQPAKAGLHGASFHDLRRANASTLVAAGVDVKTARTRLGHSDPRLTLAIYAQVVPEADRAAATALGREFFRGSRTNRARGA